MAASLNVDEQPTSKETVRYALLTRQSLILARRSIRSCRLSIVKPKPSIEKEVEEPVAEEDEIEEEDPPDPFQVGDVFWVRVPGNPYWPALIYGIRSVCSLVTSSS
jgi:hypothetical protein